MSWRYRHRPFPEKEASTEYNPSTVRRETTRSPKVEARAFVGVDHGIWWRNCTCSHRRYFDYDTVADTNVQSAFGTSVPSIFGHTQCGHNTRFCAAILPYSFRGTREEAIKQDLSCCRTWFIYFKWYLVAICVVSSCTGTANCGARPRCRQVTVSSKGETCNGEPDLKLRPNGENQ